MSDGTELFTRHWTTESPKATMLIIHGISEHSGRWSEVADHFVAEGYDVHSYDQRSHGRSGDGALDIEDFTLFCDDVAERIEALRQPGRPFVLYGHSMGGLIVTAYLASDRPKPDAAVLSAPALSAKVPKMLRFLAKVLSRIVPKLKLKSKIDGALLSADPKVGEIYAADPLVYLKVTARFGNSLLKAMDETRPLVSAITTPTFVIHGTADELVPPESSEILEQVPAIERETFEGLRHEMHNEAQASEVLRAVAKWLGPKIGA